MFAGILSSCPVCQSRQAAVDLSEIKSGRAVTTPKSLAGKLQPLMADALFLFIFLQQRRGAEQQSQSFHFQFQGNMKHPKESAEEGVAAGGRRGH